MLVKIIRKIKIQAYRLFVLIINTAIITINTIRTIAMPIISCYFSSYFVARLLKNER